MLTKIGASAAGQLDGLWRECDRITLGYGRGSGFAGCVVAVTWPGAGLVLKITIWAGHRRLRAALRARHAIDVLPGRESGPLAGWLKAHLGGAGDLLARMRDQHAEAQALAARGLGPGLRAIARELGVDRKTARRFAQAATSDEAVARAISRPTVLDRYVTPITGFAPEPDASGGESGSGFAP